MTIFTPFSIGAKRVTGTGGSFDSSLLTMGGGVVIGDGISSLLLIGDIGFSLMGGGVSNPKAS